MDPAAKKKALRLLSYGLCVATSRDDTGLAAGTINWISQSSFTPPLVMVAIKADSGLHRAVAVSRIFAVHIVGKSQKELAAAFFRGAQPAANTLNGYAVETGLTGAPLLLAPPAWFECRVVNEVRGIQTRPAGPPGAERRSVRFPRRSHSACWRPARRRGKMPWPAPSDFSPRCERRKSGRRKPPGATRCPP